MRGWTNNFRGLKPRTGAPQKHENKSPGIFLLYGTIGMDCISSCYTMYRVRSCGTVYPQAVFNIVSRIRSRIHKCHSEMYTSLISQSQTACDQCDPCTIQLHRDHQTCGIKQSKRPR